MPVKTIYGWLHLSLNVDRWKHWGRVITTDGKESHAATLDWNQLCRQRYLCDIHTQKIIEQLTKKGAFVLHMSGDELDCFTNFFNKTKCPPDMLLCVLDSILHQDQRCEKEGRQTLNFHSLSLL